VNVVYHIPGDVLRPQFDGVRTAKFSKAQRLLMVQAALPDDVADDPAAFVRRALKACIEEAETWARDRGIAQALPELHELADLV
jgi:hypothetical protein